MYLCPYLPLELQIDITASQLDIPKWKSKGHLKYMANKISDVLIQTCFSLQFFLSRNNTMIYPGITLDICFSFTLCHPHQSVGSVNSTFEMEHKSIKIPISPPQFKFKLPIFLADYFNHLLISLCINTCPLQPFSTQQNDHTKTLIILCSFRV